jgi:hypothetical protein
MYFPAVFPDHMAENIFKLFRHGPRLFFATDDVRGNEHNQLGTIDVIRRAPEKAAEHRDVHKIRYPDPTAVHPLRDNSPDGQGMSPWAFTCGIMVRILPVFRYWMVVLEVTPVLTGDVTVPVAMGSSDPTWILAGWLSVASMVGEERTLIRESALRALIKARIELPVPIIALHPPGKAVGRPLRSEMC